jgi:membrane protein implicated in regulation of membrane protease activity
MSPPPRTSHRNPLALVIAGVLLLAAVIASFWVPLYARSTPKLGAFPFFYWYQLILVPAVAIVSWIAYLLVRSDSGSDSGSGRVAAAEEPVRPPPGTVTGTGAADGPEAVL